MTDSHLSHTWRSGWLGLNAYGVETHGFVDLSMDPIGTAEAKIHWLADDGEIYSPFRLRYAPEHQRVDLLACFGDQPMESDEDDEEPTDDPLGGWSLESSDPAPGHLTATLSMTTSPEQIFTSLAAVHADMFEILDDWYAGALAWDHRWMAGPGPAELWRPAGPAGVSDRFSSRPCPPPDLDS
ncbi:hypothetical protein [Pseudonocardia sp. GCM10023141]|uniref:hypothetical protein n=1 Tax=Pseudonocardia sp. GCM10023141 TaxID=3252653 RepID=UPI0036165DB6